MRFFCVVSQLRSSGQELQASLKFFGDEGNPRGGLVCCPTSKDVLDQAIFQRLIGLDDDPSAHTKSFESCGKCGLENRELIVDRNSQGLEGPLGGVSPGASRGRRDRVSNDLRQL